MLVVELLRHGVLVQVQYRVSPRQYSTALAPVLAAVAGASHALVHVEYSRHCQLDLV